MQYFNFLQNEHDDGNYCTKMRLGPVFSNLVPEPSELEYTVAIGHVNLVQFWPVTFFFSTEFDRFLQASTVFCRSV